MALMGLLIAPSRVEADAPVAAVKTTSFVVPATVLGVSNPYVLRAAFANPASRRFTISRDIRDLVRRVDKLARFGVDLNRHTPGPEKVQLRLQSRFGGGLVQICYRR